ncbi:class I SAM-dependent DNA methyltransferase [Mycoplasma sp. Ms02]|uniref:HsdM family class I SAM-dependent methyltransferase n=1 Tax=Mycoplasma sp. Ms02 TaxID=353851 RepID=UPI001C8A181A|nr:N-6 DNA methylase [Mycoplasma sp. Ms02]QZE12563.1 SAM-dependent methyltransferase [Mycoplasma sp. Ms02]
MQIKWSLEDDVNDYVKSKLEQLGLEKNKDYNVESSMSDYMKEALRGSAKTKNKTNFGKPDFNIEKYFNSNKSKVPVVFENKLGIKKLIAKNKEDIKTDEKSIRDYAVNGAIHYATQMIDSGKYDEAIAIGVAGNDKLDVEIQVYYVYGSSVKSVKYMHDYTTLDFLESQESFDNFYKNAVLTEEDKHKLLITSKKALKEYATKLNKLMNNLNITAPQRVLYVSGMILSMQDIVNSKGQKIKDGLTPEDLKGIQTDLSRDGKIISLQIEEFLKARDIEPDKQALMLASFSEISKDKQRDEPVENQKIVADLLDKETSCNKQIFTFIYEYVFKQIDGISGHIDIMGEMYSEFLKYALGDGKDIGIVLTPPYITKLMAQILDISDENRVMDLSTGSAGFLISSMELMIASAEAKFGKGTERANQKIQEIKKKQLLGVELNAEMYTLAATNMILRGDGQSNIQKGNTFKTPEEMYTNFNADRLLLNPPFSYEENGMPFILFGLDRMQKGGLGAIIIQDSAGSGKAINTNRQILKNHTLVASIKMPVDLFVPMAGVQTSIYVFEVGKPHDFEKTVKFIDFRNDGFKRTARGINETDNPMQRYQDIIKIYKAGKSAKVDPILWNLDEIYIEDFIDKSYADWNFDKHAKIEKIPTEQDFKQTVSEYLSWEIGNILKETTIEDDIKK